MRGAHLLFGWLEIRLDRALLSRLCGRSDLVNEKPDLNSSATSRTTRRFFFALLGPDITTGNPNSRNAGASNMVGRKVRYRTQRSQNGVLIRVQAQGPVA